MNKRLLKDLLNKRFLLFFFIMNVAADAITILTYQKSEGTGFLFDRYLLSNTDFILTMIWLSGFVLFLYVVCNSYALDFSHYGVFCLVRYGRKRFFLQKIRVVLLFAFGFCSCSFIESLLTFLVSGISIDWRAANVFSLYFLWYVFFGFFSLFVFMFIHSIEFSYLLCVLLSMGSVFLLNRLKVNVLTLMEKTGQWAVAIGILIAATAIFLLISFRLFLTTNLSLSKMKE